MTPRGITPAVIDFSDPAAPRSPVFDDVYHTRAGALAQARHVFLGGNRLPARWQGRARFVVLETGFGLGHNFIATWAAWRADPARCERLVFVSIDKHPPTAADLARAHAGSAEPALCAELQRAWPPLTPDTHLLEFDGGRVRLLLVLGDIADALPDIAATVDAFYLDGFAPARNPAMWAPGLLQRLGRLAAPDATAATWSVAVAMRDALAQAGFEVQLAPGFGGKREITVARFAPRFQPRRPPGRQAAGAAERAGPVVVVGSGLAGAAAAWALARQGLACTVLEQAEGPAPGASGNAGGLFHGVLHADDAPHARWFRAVALQAQRSFAPWLADGSVSGRLAGLLRLEAQATLDEMQARLARSGLPPDHVQALGRDDAARRAGLPLGHPAWFYPGGGWLAPASLVARLLATPGVTLRTGQRVAGLRRHAEAWQLLDDAGHLIEQAPLVVLANAMDAMRLAGASWPLQSVRGQVTLLDTALPGLPRPALPVAGAGYALTLPDGRVLCGATSQPGDNEPALRAADQAHNLAHFERLAGWRAPSGLPLAGRVGWRCTADDRLPLIGPLPTRHPSGAAPAGATRLDQPRLLPREPGLWTLTGLGSRGITQALLSAELLAAWIVGAPLPLPSRLVDRVDVARFAARTPRG